LDLQGVKSRITRLRGSLSKKQFSENVNMNPSYLSQIENPEDSQKPSIEALVAISQYCNVSVDFILTGREYTSRGMATNQSFVGAFEARGFKTPLARNMVKNLNSLLSSVHEVDIVGTKYANLKALEGTASALSINSETHCELNNIRNCCSPGSEDLS